MIDYAAVLIEFYPDSVWMLEGSEYEGLSWTPEDEKPSKDTLDAQWEELSAIQAARITAEAERKAAAISKLEAIGLTADDLQAILGA